ncbi:ASCH domain-containing protein [Tepidibacter formicigenes]|jgi:hypothetical protein|uniref:ASCH domain-containing protein n=1 Tax=Tepidibacter formicigenes DSM 15518 TaxID=1123349 RepID=A0A1M6U774_9FIRM|nr:ASCH domain-containing protein [Tepidibacter formicigenes]SHK65006.1 ASCH domain-containing protein [Tepidibacter formicigenes DSM 15518]
MNFKEHIEKNNINGLIIKSPYIEKILSHEKTWEIRSHKTKIRGEIALIKKGSKKILGTCKVVDVIGPLYFKDLISTNKHCIPKEKILQNKSKYEGKYAWILSDAKTLKDPIDYNHPRGAVIWVKLKDRLI